MAPEPALLQLDQVDRRIGRHVVLQGVSFALQRGEVLGLLGANGAGKSTTLAIIAGALAPDAGRVLIDGRDVDRPGPGRQARIGWVPESVPLWPELTVVEALDACGRLRGLSRLTRRLALERALARLDLTALARRLCGRLSLGQKRRVGLAQALLHDPDLLVLDEPANGLDPVQVAHLRAIIDGLASGHGIILSSHDLAEVEATCDRVVVLHEGKVRLDARPDGAPGALAARFHDIVGVGAAVDAAA